MDAQWIGTLVNALATVIVGILGLAGVRYSKRSAKEKEIQKELDKTKQKNLDDKLNDITSSLNNLTNQIDTMRTELDSVKRDNKKQQEDIEAIMHLSKLDMDYTRSLSNVVTAVAEGLRDNNINGNVTHALEVHHAFEAQRIDGMYNILEQASRLD